MIHSHNSHFSHFHVTLEATVRGLTDPADKLTAAATALATYLNAWAFELGHSWHNEPGRNCPHPLHVEVSDPMGRISKSFCSGPGKEEVSTNTIFETAIGYHGRLVIRGHPTFFLLQDQLRRLPEIVEDTLEKEFQTEARPASLHAASPHGRPLQKHTRTWLNDMPLCRRLLPALFKGLDLIALAEGRPEQRKKMRWAWITHNAVAPQKKPYIYLYAQAGGEKFSPYLANPDASHGIIHRILEQRIPGIVWDYQNDPGWNIPPDRRKEFCQLAEADRFPHLVYVPVSRRLALQISFGPGDSPTSQLAFANRFRDMAAAVILSSYQEALQTQVTELFTENPGLSLSPGASRTAATADLESMTRLLTELYPVPPIELATRDLTFAPCDPSDQFAIHAAQYATNTMNQAVQFVHARAQAEQYRRYGATALGVKHTLRRPIQLMQEFVKLVAFNHLNDHPIQVETARMGRYLTKVEVMTTLDIRNLEAIEAYAHAATSDQPICRCNGNQVVKVLQEAGFFKPKPRKSKAATTTPSQFAENWQGFPVMANITEVCSYSAPAESLALIIAELVSNAADFLQRQRLHVERRPKVIVSLDSQAITVENPICGADPGTILTTILSAMGTWGRSVHKVVQLANLIGFTFAQPKVKQDRLRITIRRQRT